MLNFLTMCVLMMPVHATASEVALFPDGSLEAWTVVGGKACYAFEDGVLVGQGTDRVNSFLTSKKSYGDFILQVEVQIIRGNSGIQVRSHDVDNRLVGYQIESDPSDRAWSGGLYDEGRRGWLQPPAEHVRDAFQLGQWNTYKIVCIGPRIKATVNGKVTTDFLDFMDLSGRIGFQVHSGDCKVMWRNATIFDLDEMNRENGIQSSPLTLQPLFDGQTLGGMEHVGSGVWSVEEGAIVGLQTPDAQETGVLWIKEPYEEFAVQLKFKIDRGNSGFFFRSQQLPNDNTGIRGIQVEVDRQLDCGGLYETGGRGWISMPTEQFSHYDRWNDLMIYTSSDRVMVWLNKNLIVNCNTAPRIEKIDQDGYSNNFAFQLHKRQDVEVRFKDIEIMVPTNIDGQGNPISGFVGADYLN